MLGATLRGLLNVRSGGMLPAANISNVRSAETGRPLAANAGRGDQAEHPVVETRTGPGGVVVTAPFGAESFEGEVNPALAPAELEQALETITDPGRARETVHWGRNYLYAVDLVTDAGPIEVIVKQFRNQGLAARLKRRFGGSKATRSWRAAWALVEAGIETPEPVLLAESTEPEGPSFFVTRRLEGFLESRYYFRALIAGSEREDFPHIDRDDFIRSIGEACRRLHDAGIWHRDISIGNLLLGSRDDPSAVHVIDLNRARLNRRLGLWRRTRDVCRLPFPDRESRRLFLASYWNTPGAVGPLRRGLFWLFQQSFLARNRVKAVIRRPFLAAKGLVRERRPHAHIPSAPEGAEVRDKIVWDHLSDQPHQHATRAERAQVRFADVGAHASAASALLLATPKVWRRYRKLRRRLFGERMPWNGVGVAVRPRPEDPDGLLETLDSTGVRRVLIRLHPWEETHSDELELAQELTRRGYELSFALPQNRDLVRDPERWSAAVERLAEIFLPFGRHFQIGQAINRSKWGVWTYGEYLELAARAGDILRREESVVLMGPAVIDFEFQATAAVVNMRCEGVHFDILSSLLYVDRRGAPENEQLGFDSPAKAALLKAIAETGRNSGGRCWVTEVNWPLWEGPHSPAGRTVSVDEETQADFLCRYYLLMLSSGMVERVYWWRLVARGYGLVEPGSKGRLRARPSHRALAVMEGELAGGTFERLLEGPADARLMLFSRGNGTQVVVAWSLTGPKEVDLPRPATFARDRDGAEIRLDEGQRVEISTSPKYFHLCE